MPDDFNLAKLEEKTLEFWDKNKIFEKSLEQTREGKPFTFYDGPPFATGLPHYGHILASTIKDVVPRYQTMNGHLVRRRWGWDCHGLPIEEIVERKLGISGKKQIEEVGIKKFNETCRSMVLQYVSEWRSMVRRIARWVDFDNSYKTMDTDYMESVWWTFKEIYDKGLIYEGRKVLLYCPRCETPVSNFEVAMDNSYKDVVEESVTVKFHLVPGQKFGNYVTKDEAYILAWTTTPWTLPGNVALAVGKDLAYTALRIKDQGDLYILSSDLVKKNFDGQSIEIVRDDIKGKDLVGLSYEPLFDVPAARSEKSYKVYAADFVTTDEGTGVVHTAVVYGEDDYALGVREGLPVVPLLDEKGKFNEKAPELVRGMYFKDSEKIIKDDLTKRGLLFKRENHTHSYPFCWRCGTTLFYNAIPAWFVNIQKIKPRLLTSNAKEINWFPKHLKHGRYEKSVEAAPDWNISRNRYWGNPIPAWKCDACERVEVVGSLQELSLKTGGAKNHYWGIRHGQSENIMLGVSDSGDQNFHLTPLGKEEIKEAAQALKDKKIDLIFASDILRTKESAEIISKELGIPFHEDPRLREINVGGFSGKPSAEYSGHFAKQEDRFTATPELAGESLRDVRARAWNFLQEMEKKHHGKNILIVSHEDTLWMLAEVAHGWGEKQTAEKKDDGKVFLHPAGIISLPLKNIPRNDTGEADMHRPYIDEIVFPCGKGKCDGVMRRTPEIFDSWMEAGSMPFAEYHYPFENKEVFESRFPAQFVAEYIAQTRAWFYVMHVISEVLFGKAPFENVVTTGTILAEDGSKMSKSKNNFPDPNVLIEKYGADSLRFYLMNSVVMQADNLNFSEQAVGTIYRKVALILWNVCKFFTTYVESSQIAASEKGESGNVGDKKAASENVLDRWIRVRNAELVSNVTEYLDSYDTVRATRAIQEYVDDLSTWYLRRSRKRKDAGFATTFYESLLTVSTVIAPFMPFLAEEIYQKLKPYHTAGSANLASESVHLTAWPVANKRNAKEKAGDQKLLQDMMEVRRLASLALGKRSEAGIKVRQPLATLTVKNSSLLEELFGILAEEVNVKNVVADPKLKEDVELDTALTAELREEGLLREVIRMVQGLRQDADLEPKDKIEVMLDAHEAARSAIQNNEASFKAEVGAHTIEYKKSDKFTAEQTTKLDGQEVWVGIRKL